MAAPAYAAVGTANGATTNSLSLSAGFPATVNPNDIALLLVIRYNPNGVSSDISTPSGFTIGAKNTFQNSSAVIVGRAALFWKRCDGTEDGATISLSCPDGDTGTDGVFYARCCTFSGCETSGDPWDAIVFRGGPGNATVTFDAVTVSGAERTLVIGCVQAANTDPGSVAGYTPRVSGGTTTGSDAHLKVWDKANVSSDGSTTAPTGTTLGWATWHISLKPPGVTPRTGDTAGSASIATALTGDTGGSATIQKARTGDTAGSATLQGSVTGDTQGSAAIRQARTGDTAGSAAVAARYSGETQGSAAIQQPRTAETQGSATVLQRRTGDTDGAAAVASAHTGETAASAAIRQARTADTPGSAAVATPRTSDTPGAASVQQPRTADTQGSATIRAQLTGDTQGSATVASASGRTADTPGSASILAPRAGDTAGAAAVMQARNADTPGSAGIAGAKTGDTQASAAVRWQRTGDVPGSVTIQASFVADTPSSGAVAVPATGDTQASATLQGLVYGDTPGSATVTEGAGAKSADTQCSATVRARRVIPGRQHTYEPRPEGARVERRSQSQLEPRQRGAVEQR